MIPIIRMEIIYQLGVISNKDGKEERSANTSAPVGQVMQMEFPEIEDKTRLMRLFSDDKTLFQYSDATGNTNSFYETKGYSTTYTKQILRSDQKEINR